MWKRCLLVPTAAIALAFVACTDGAVGPDGDPESAFLKKAKGGDISAPADPASAISAMIDAANAGLTAAGAGYRVAMAEYVTGEGDQAGATVISKDLGNKQLTADFVPNDTRRVGWSGPDITYAVDMTGGSTTIPASVGPMTAEPILTSRRLRYTRRDTV